MLGNSNDSSSGQRPVRSKWSRAASSRSRSVVEEALRRRSEVEEHHHQRDADQRDAGALVVLAVADDQQHHAGGRDRRGQADADEPQDHGCSALRTASVAPASTVLVKPALMSVKPSSR